MGKLRYNNKEVLSSMKIATSTWAISKGLMFASKKKIKKGMCLVMPVKDDVQFGAAVTMMFCFHKMEIIFINSKYEIVDKVILKPWRVSYIPKQPCHYVIESLPGTFKDFNIGDRVEIVE